MDEDRRRALLKPRRDHWLARAAGFTEYRPSSCLLTCKCDACKPSRQRRYALARASTLDKRIAPRLAMCGVEKVPIACACHRGDALVRCRQWLLCEACQVARSAERKTRIREGLEEAMRIEIDAWGAAGARGMRPRFILITLTHRHTGDLARDHKELAAGWRRLYKSMHPSWGRFPYVGFWEITPGRCGDCLGYCDGDRDRCQCDRPRPEGHLHLHVVAVWRFRDWSRVSKLWRVACPSSERIHFAAARRDRRATSARSAASYLAKYVSKGVQGESFTPQLRADASAAMYNAHAFVTSKGFWLPRDRDCRKCHTRVRRIVTIAPRILEILRAAGEHTYWLEPREGFSIDEPPLPDAAITLDFTRPPDHGTWVR